MLVLTRQLDQSIVIGDDIAGTITVVEIKGDQVRLGVRAPQERPRPPQGDLRADREENCGGGERQGRGVPAL